MGFGVHVITKSDLVLRDLDLIQTILKVHALVTFSISTTDDEFGRKIEPGASLPSARFAAIKTLAENGVYTGISMMPILPFLEDSEENIGAVVRKAADCGAAYILPWFGMSMRDRQRDYFYAQLDRLFPGLRQKYEHRYGLRYGCRVPNADRLEACFHTLRRQYGIAAHVPSYEPQLQARQLSLL